MCFNGDIGDLVIFSTGDIARLLKFGFVLKSCVLFFREDMVIFSGGMSYDRAGRTPSITVMTGKSTTVLEMEHNIMDFVVLCETPWSHGKCVLVVSEVFLGG